MRFADLLRATVLLSAAAATLLVGITVLAVSAEYDPAVVIFSLVWWSAATGIGMVMGRGAQANPPIARLLATARHQPTLPEPRVGRTMLNRLWPLLLVSLGAGVIGLFFPQVSGVAAGFCLIWALAWRNQHLAVQAIEERDGARFYVDRTSPFTPMRLLRTPGFGGTFVRRPI